MINAVFRVGINGTISISTLDGRCVKTIVLTIPYFAAIRLQQIKAEGMPQKRAEAKAKDTTYPEAKDDTPAMMLHTNSRPPRKDADTPYVTLK
ncbi:hypothetical protein ABBQ38_008476 [Trebouxia sp. C0009 RCD-2024]